MSLINQMLRDLDKYKASEIPPIIEKSAIQVTRAAPEKTYKGLIIRFMVLILLLCSSLFFILQSSSYKAPSILVRSLALPELHSVNRQQIKPVKATAPSEYLPLDPVLTKAKIPVKISGAVKPLNVNTQAAPPSINIIKKTAPPQQQSLYQAALKTADTDAAIHLLQALLNSQAKHLEARLLLTTLLIKSGEQSTAANLLDESLSLWPHESALIAARAQLYLQSKNASAALQLLTAQLPPVQNENYLALLAAAYQQSNQPQQARQQYQRLAHMHPGKAAYWLGLGVTEDTLGHTQQAYNAYQQALQLGNLDDAVSDYIQQRIKKLTQRL